MTETWNMKYAALLLRLALGVMFVAHGLLKLFVFTLPGTVQFFEAVGFAGWMAYPVTFAEIAGGVALILGLYTRWVALALVPVLVGAAVVHWPNGWMFSVDGGGWEYPVFLAVVSVAQAVLGDGALALRPAALPKLTATLGTGA